EGDPCEQPLRAPDRAEGAPGGRSDPREAGGAGDRAPRVHAQARGEDGAEDAPHGGRQRRVGAQGRRRRALREARLRRRGPDGQALHAPGARPGHQDLQAHEPHHRGRGRPRRGRGGVSVGQKVHPKGFRLGVIENWDSRWFARREYAELLHEDIKIRNFLKKRLYHAGVSKIEIERAANKAKINIHTARPGIVSGKRGSEIARTEWYREGRVPLHTLRADVNYGLAEAKTTYGVIGVKCWIFRGEVLTKQEEEQRAALGV